MADPNSSNSELAIDDVFGMAWAVFENGSACRIAGSLDCWIAGLLLSPHITSYHIAVHLFQGGAGARCDDH
eukprot:jgi/Hompol1/3029/HPOL_003099-RA